MKRVLSVLLAAVLCVGMLTGCGEKKDAGEVESVVLMNLQIFLYKLKI